jgi:hypothetical protein
MCVRINALKLHRDCYLTSERTYKQETTQAGPLVP